MSAKKIASRIKSAAPTANYMRVASLNKTYCLVSFDLFSYINFIEFQTSYFWLK